VALGSERLARSEPHVDANLLDALTSQRTRALHDAHVMERERQLLARRLAISSGDVLAVGAGWNPGRHLFPAPAFRMVAIDSDPMRVMGVLVGGRADEAYVGAAATLLRSAAAIPGLAGPRPALLPGSFDVVLYRLVLHHIAYQGPLSPAFVEAAALLRPGGAMVVIEPGLWHPVGLALALANRWGRLATWLHGTPDDIPLSPRRLLGEARAAGLQPELHAITYAWRRMPAALQSALRPLDAVGSRPRAAVVGHTLLMIARRG
jgi:SAM-dependent methyltransferase